MEHTLVVFLHLCELYVFLLTFIGLHIVLFSCTAAVWQLLLNEYVKMLH